MTISMDKKYRTKEGHDVRIYAVDGLGYYPVHGAIWFENFWRPASWDFDGEHVTSSLPPFDKYDLIEVKPRIKRTVWLNVYEDNMHGLHRSKENADAVALENRLACVRVEIDCEEGEGL